MIQRLSDTSPEGRAPPPAALGGPSLRIKGSRAGDAGAVLRLTLAPRVPQALALHLLARTLSPAGHDVASTALLVGTSDATPLDKSGRCVLLDEGARVDSRRISHDDVRHSDSQLDTTHGVRGGCDEASLGQFLSSTGRHLEGKGEEC